MRLKDLHRIILVCKEWVPQPYGTPSSLTGSSSSEQILRRKLSYIELVTR